MSILIYALIRRAENFRVRAEFEEEATGRASAVEKAIECKLVVLESLRAFIRTPIRHEREHFRTFTDPLLARVRGIQALAWLPRVRDADRARFEVAAQRDGLPGFQITERNAQGQMVRAPRREEYFPALLMEPYRGNEPALGFDPASCPIRRLALHRARDTGRAAATAPITLVQETGHQAGFLVYLPIYGGDEPSGTVEARRKHFTGVVSGVFRVGDLMEEALAHVQPAGIDVHVFDRSASGVDRLFYSHTSRLAQGARARDHPHTEAALFAGVHRRDLIDVAGRQWSIVCVPAPVFVSTRQTWYPWVGLAGGLLMTGLLTAYLVKAGRTAETLRESEARYQDLYDNAPDMFASVDAKTARILQCNNTVAAALGYSKEEIVGRSIFDVYHPDCMDEVEKLFQTFVRTGEVRDAELQLKRKDGGKIDISLNVSAVRDEHGEVLYSRSVWRDITERKQAEREIENLAKFPSENPQPVMRIDADGVVLYANAASRPILEARDSGVGRTVPQDWRDLVARALSTGEIQETEVADAGRAFSFQVLPITETGYANWYGRDITERKNAQEAAQTAHQELLDEHRHARQRAEAELAIIRDELVRTAQLAAIGQVSVSIAHDLRNPLGSARNAVYYLKRRVVGDRPEIKEYLDIIDQEIDASDRIIENLLAAARTREPVRQRVDLGRTVNEVFDKGGWGPGARCRLVLDPDPFVLEADPDQLRQVLRNILTNAMQAMQDGGELLVDASRGPDGDTIVFRDTGPGVPAETRDSLFEPLVTTKAKGIGLGLTICRQIIERHNGTIELINDSGQGAAFRIRLPRPKR